MLPADVVDVLLERVVRDGGPRLYGEVAAVARGYVDDIVPLGRPTTASGREAVQQITGYRSLDLPAAQPLVRPDADRLRRLSRRNRQDADVALAPVETMVCGCGTFASTAPWKRTRGWRASGRRSR